MNTAELQVLLEGVSLPADKHALIRYAREQQPSPDELAALEKLPEREYDSLDDVGEALQPVQPVVAPQDAESPRPESDLPPGGNAYTDASEEPGWVRDRPSD
jgi:hypothetical protein